MGKSSKVSAIEVIERHCDEKARQNDIIRHNNVVFQDGQKALKVLPDLVGKVPEAKLNLANYYLRQNEVEAAAALLEGVEANCPQSHALLGVIKAEMGQANRLPASLAESISHFQSVGNSQAESDTILGRQCLASSFILQKKYEDSLVYLESIQLYLENDDTFRWNYGIASAAAGRHDEAVEVLENVSDESLKSELAYVVWLARSYLKTGDMDKAWACLDTDDQSITYELLQLLANECYKLGGGHFLFSARAFKELFQIDKFPDYLKGFIGASVGFFRYCIAIKESALKARDFEALNEVADLLEAFAIPKGRSIAKVIRNWIKQYT